MNLSDLEKRIAVLEDIEAIKKLKARYCAICDEDHNPAKITALFAPDGIWEGAGVGRHQGHDAIRKLFQGFQERISFSQHNVMNPIIDVDGDRATGIWVLHRPVHDAQWKSRDVARRTLRRRLRQAKRRVEVHAPARDRPDVGAVRKRLGQVGRYLELNSSSLDLTTSFTASTAGFRIL
ncbi:MAG TPA: nuclear transport factor 2 family protein [Candidatus Binatus sp.]|uniref:nuclear transport factor 2 family protein n=1 Tax=Candidatus Binatus sp. TaxID=2811406 RepID=UPI002B459F70|nr:nuclear transport factor 2 family protein [Candidatus Binatus sp.]HKN14285.1 nuclear transport factor 2 family protein [Candidatus Binatus sp.]